MKMKYWLAQKNGQDYDFVLPQSSIRIENPVAVVDSYVDKHGTREGAEAFVAFLLTEEAQTIFAEYGLRSVDPAVATATAEQYPALADQFTDRLLWWLGRSHAQILW